MPPMRFLPVCCTVDIPAETINKFMTAAYDASEPGCFMLVIVRDNKEKHEDVTNPPIDKGVFESPFKGKTAVECYHVLDSIRNETGSELNHWYFVVMDQQSKEDGSVLLVGYEEGEGDKISVCTVRTYFRGANAHLASLSIGHIGWDEVQEHFEQGGDRPS